jgi:branched-subunit amino acid aminotransferase/4-amino-4-deoxychorismate lyase
MTRIAGAVAGRPRQSALPGAGRCQTAGVAELDGEPVAPEALQALALTNVGHFTSMRVDDGRVRGLSLHLARLVRDCRTVFAADLDPQHVLDLVRWAVRGGHDGRVSSVVVRVTVFDPALEIGRPGAAATPHVLVTTRPAPPAVPPPLRVRSCVFRRELPEVKHIGLFAALHQRRVAQRAGFDDALFTDPAGAVSEGPTWNIGFCDGNGVVWPEADVLPGVTMALLQQACEHTVSPVTLKALGRMRAAFAVNAAVGVRPVGAVDGAALPVDHPGLDALARAYAAVPGDPL